MKVADMLRGCSPYDALLYGASAQVKLTVVGGVGLYLDPPDDAVVLSVDEKSRIQALDPTPMKKGAGSDHDARLRPQWHHHPVRRPCRRKAKSVMEPSWEGDRGMHAAPPCQGVPAVSSRRSPSSSPTTSMCTSCGTTTGPTRPRRSRAGSSITSASSCPSRPLLVLAQRSATQASMHACRSTTFFKTPRRIGCRVISANRRSTRRNRKPKPFRWTAKADTILERTRPPSCAASIGRCE